MATYIAVAQMIVSVALVAVIVLQSRTSGGLGGIFGGDQGVFRTRRGVEKTLFNFTLVLGVAFAVVSLLAAAMSLTG